LDQIAETDRGLKYLDWLFEERLKEGKREPIDKALELYLSDATIQKELERINR
jgi:hypothetical protein